MVMQVILGGRKFFFPTKAFSCNKLPAQVHAHKTYYLPANQMSNIHVRCQPMFLNTNTLGIQNHPKTWLIEKRVAGEGTTVHLTIRICYPRVDA